MSRRTYDTDDLTIRNVYPRSSQNQLIPGLRVLTSDGKGGSYWAVPSTLGYNPSFNQVNVGTSKIVADESYNTLTFTQGSGIGIDTTQGSNNLSFYAKAFSQIDVSGNNTITTFANNTLNPTLKFAGTGGMRIHSDSVRNTITFDSQAIYLSTSQYTFQKINVLSNTSTVSLGISNITNGSYVLNATNPSSILTFVGLDTISMTTDQINNAVYVGFNTTTGSFSSLTGKVNTISTTVGGLPSTLSNNVSSLYVNNATFGEISTSFYTSSLKASTIGFIDIYTKQPQVVTIENGNFQINGTPVTGNFSTNQYFFYSSISTVYTNGTTFISSIVNAYLSPFTLSTFTVSTGNFFTSSINLIDTVTHSQYALAVNNGNLQLNGGPITSGLQSTVLGLGTAGYVSSQQLLSSSYGVTRAITSNFTVSIASTVTGLGTAGYISSSHLLSTTVGILAVNSNLLDFALTSTIVGLATTGYVSSQQLISSTYGIQSNVQLTLVSSIIGLGTTGYISSQQLLSSVEGITRTQVASQQPTLTSTINGLGTAGYISTTQLLSTSQGLLYIITRPLTIVLPADMTSSIIGLGSAGYISSLQLQSTIVGASNVVQPTLTSTVRGLGTAGYISSTQLFSTMNGLSNIAITNLSAGTNIFLSTGQNGLIWINATGLGRITQANIVSSVIGLGTAGYVSTTGLTSTMYGTSLNLNTKRVNVSSIGVNSNSSKYMLDVNGPTNITSSLNVSYVGSVNATLGIATTANGFSASVGDVIVQGTGAATQRMWLATAANTNNMILSNGRVGINCNNPQYTLDVNGSVNFTTATTNLSLGNNISLEGTSAGIDQSLLLSNTVSGLASQFALVGVAGDFAANTSVGDTVIKGIGSGTTQRTWITTTGNASNMVLSNGRVGVNCNNPQYTLDVNGLFHTSSVGINTAAGVATPGSAGGNISLDVNGSARSAVLYSNHTTGGTITLTEAMYGVYFNITTNPISVVNGTNLTTSATSNYGKYFVFRNNTGNDIGSVTITGMTVTSAPLYSNASMTLMNVGGIYALF